MRKKIQAILPLLALAALAAPAGAGGAQTAPSGDPGGDPPIVVFLVRHAEKARDDPRDPDLTPAGRARADGLAAMLSRSGVTHLFASEFRRTQATLAPLATAAGVEVRVIPAAEAERQVAALRALPPGAVAVVAGHSNTVPGLVRRLGGDLEGTSHTEHGEMLGDDEYDRMFVVVLPAGGKDGPGPGVQTLELRYGG